MIFCQRQKAAYVIGKEVLSKMGVKQMYKEFAVYCQEEIREALMVFADPKNYPIEIHCTQGKDRTGMVAAFVLCIARVPEDIIVNDYAKTQKGLAPVYKEMLEDVRRAGLSDDFAEAPPQVFINKASALSLSRFLSFFSIVYERIAGLLEAKVWIYQ